MKEWKKEWEKRKESRSVWGGKQWTYNEAKGRERREKERAGVSYSVQNVNSNISLYQKCSNFDTTVSHALTFSLFFFSLSLSLSVLSFFSREREREKVGRKKFCKRDGTKDNVQVLITITLVLLLIETRVSSKDSSSKFLKNKLQLFQESGIMNTMSKPSPPVSTVENVSNHNPGLPSEENGKNQVMTSIGKQLWIISINFDAKK